MGGFFSSTPPVAPIEPIVAVQGRPRNSFALSIPDEVQVPPPRNQGRRTRQSKTRYAWKNRVMNTRFGRSRTRYAPPIVSMNTVSDRGNDLPSLENNSARSFSPENERNNARSDVSYGPPQPSQRRATRRNAQVAQQRVRSSPPPSNSPRTNWRGPAMATAAGYTERRRAASASPEASVPSRAASASPGASAAPSRVASASPEASAAPSRAASASPAVSVNSSAASAEPEDEYEVVKIEHNSNQDGGSKRSITRKSKKSKKSKKRIVRPLKKALSLSRSTR